MTATETRIRRGTNAQIAAFTPASSEVIHDTTNQRLYTGDGSTLGGFAQASAKDVQNQAFTYGTAGGTADALTLTLSPAIASYAAGQSFMFKASANNTGAATVNVNSLGAKNIYKLSGGALGALSAGDIVSGAIYKITYDGTQFLIIGLEASASSSDSGLVLLDVQTASSSSQLDFETDVGSTYPSYILSLEGIVLSSASAYLGLRVKQNGSYKSAGGDYVSLQMGLNSSLTETNQAGPTTTAIVLTTATLASSTSYHSGQIKISALTGDYPAASGIITKQLTSGSSSMEMTNFSGSCIDSTSQVQGFRLFPNIGTLTSGTGRLYGLRSTV